MYAPVRITPGYSSMAADGEERLDPFLFDPNMVMRSDIRYRLLSTLTSFMSTGYAGVSDWLKVWVAGSGASFHWNAPGLKDLDVLLGIDFVMFRQANNDFRGISDKDISKIINEQLREGLWPETARWLDRYEVTWYVNPRSQDIRTLNPYAAYDLVENRWAVRPTTGFPQVPPEWDSLAEQFRNKGTGAVFEYNAAIDQAQRATGQVQRVNSRARLSKAVQDAVSLFDDVHEARSLSFSDTGMATPYNHLWQSGKADGWLTALRSIKEQHEADQASSQESLYGSVLPDAEVLRRRAAMQYRSGQ